MASAAKANFSITSGWNQNKSRLYAVITTEDGANASIFADGSFRIRWASGDVSQATMKAGLVANPDEDVKKMLHVFEEMIPTVHLAPKGFANEDAAKEWFRSIGLDWKTIEVN
jgi:hypothetical protein